MEVDVWQEVDLSKLYFPTEDERESGWGPFRDYWPLSGYSWAETEECFRWETRSLAGLSARTPDEEDRFLDSIDVQACSCGLLDLGVGAAVVALSAAGCAPLVSCNGHFGRQGAWAPYPLIKFAADEARVNLIVPIAADTDCGLCNSEEGAGAIELWAETVDHTLAFAETLVKERASFDGLPTASPTDDDVGWDQGHLLN